MFDGVLSVGGEAGVEAGDPIGILRDSVGQDLQRDVMPKLAIAGTVHLAHASFADRRDDFVDAEARAWSEAKVARLYERKRRADGLSPH
jgi:hypothetical protein